ncbi:DsbA family protein [Lysobacter sp. F60174L2]|uniref:DsbA family protein n=1 Tax=Lysobacter sp. F60174L2 TaxID=3459295 RepID=UPI00403DC09F
MKSALPRLALHAVLSLSALFPLSALAASPGPAPVAGTDYVEIAGGEPFAPQPGRIEVVEVFGYTCIHCAHFEPLVSEWKAGLPADVSFVPVPAPFGGYWIPYAQAFHAAKAQGLLGKTHGAVFNALHEAHSLPVSNATPAEIAGFYAAYGADTEQFIADMASEATAARLQHAREFLRRSGVQGTPTLIVAGRYRVLGDSFEELLDTATALVEMERARLKRGASN